MQLKKQVASYAEEKSNQYVASHYGVDPKKGRKWKKDLRKITLLCLIVEKGVE